MSIIYINPYQFAAAAPAAFLLDDYPGAAVAYSLRQLRTGVTNVVRVRRDNDNSEDDFTATEVSDGTLAAWVGAGNDGFVRTWYDQSGNNADVTNYPARTPPKVVTNGIVELDPNTGQPSLLFDGTQRMIFNRQTEIEQLFCVARNNTSTTKCISRDSGVGLNVNDVRNLAMRLTPEAWNMQQIGPYPVTGQNLVVQNQTYSLGILANGVNAVYYTNGASSPTFSEADKIQANELGSHHVGGFPFSGNISEYILYSADQSINRVAIEANINAHYSIYP